jgi:hypothetical protein
MQILIDGFLNRATKGVGLTQPVDWKDAGRALGHPELIGCHMPAGPGKDVSSLYPGAYLQYNEVRYLFLWAIVPLSDHTI